MALMGNGTVKTFGQNAYGRRQAVEIDLEAGLRAGARSVRHRPERV